MKLNYKQHGIGKPILFLHGVLGNLDNLSQLAKGLVDHYQIIQVDMRNHGLSPWSDSMDYALMAEDIVELCHDLQLTEIIVIGHSMGGKVAMKLTQVAPNLIKQLVILDIAPVAYHDDAARRDPNKQVFAALKPTVQLTDKKQIITHLHEAGLDDATSHFLLKSFKHDHWLPNLAVIIPQYEQIRDWQTIPPWYGPALFIRGGNSHYISDDDYADIVSQFPYAQIITIDGAGHNVHAEKTQEVLTVITDWLAS
ncbi:alpha/beta fold hydrolase [Orbaceae bacterium ESL0727]|nr:alpha/beta fold hydrolase [Orbaceae bacterium ESL0727]